MYKIKYIKFNNHAIFKNQVFDFTINNVAADNVIIAGLNGVGKTKLLEELYEICKATYYVDTVNLENVSHEVGISIDEENKYNIDEMILYVEKTRLLNNKYIVIFKSKGNIINNINIISIKLNSIYSNVDINYKPLTNVNGPNNKKISDDMYPKDIANIVIQHLVNIIVQDSLEYTSNIRENKESKLDRRLKKFIDAFKLIFSDKLVYLTLKDNSIPIFKKNNQNIEITSLSSGEKQIIFRGTYLIGNMDNLNGGPVFIDEPEISMHPSWEDKIFSYYTNLFKENNKQTSQVFMATHSEHILTEGLKEENRLVIKLKENEYEKYYKGSKGTILPVITKAEVNYIIFDIYSNDLHTLLYGYISEHLVKNSKGKIVKNPSVTMVDKWLKTENVTNKKYKFKTNKKNLNYYTLQTYIRNCIDHPQEKITYTDEELEKSIEEMIKIINKYK